ncbi:MAG: DUF2779 domain-containing protein [Gemmatimonadota bacterium]
MKQLWWRVHEPDAVELQPDKVLQDLFDQGRQVGEIARRRFPNATLIPPGERAQRLEATRSAIAAGATVLLEAAFEADDVFISTDVLERTALGWRLIEVKSSSSYKKEKQLADIGVQTHVLARSGITPVEWHVLHLNGDFRHPDTGDLFAQTDVAEDVRAFAPNVAEAVRRQLEVLDGPLPTVEIGRHCAEPYDCLFEKRCFPDDDQHISTLHNCGPATFPKFVARGIHRIDQLPATEKLQHTQKRQIRALRSGKMVVEPTLARDLEPFNVEPLGFLDFETIMRAVPVWDGTKPWEQVAAQFSYHESVPGGGIGMRSI